LIFDVLSLHRSRSGDPPEHPTDAAFAAGHDTALRMSPPLGLGTGGPKAALKIFVAAVADDARGGMPHEVLADKTR
jgi:hypothetical protein